MEMKRTDHVKTAIRWRPPTDDREKAIEKVSENVNMRLSMLTIIVHYSNSSRI